MAEASCPECYVLLERTPLIEKLAADAKLALRGRSNNKLGEILKNRDHGLRPRPLLSAAPGWRKYGESPPKKRKLTMDMRVAPALETASPTGAPRGTAMPPPLRKHSGADTRRVAPALETASPTGAPRGTAMPPPLRKRSRADMRRATPVAVSTGLESASHNGGAPRPTHTPRPRRTRSRSAAVDAWGVYGMTPVDEVFYSAAAACARAAAVSDISAARCTAAQCDLASPGDACYAATMALHLRRYSRRLIIKARGLVDHDRRHR